MKTSIDNRSLYQFSNFVVALYGILSILQIFVYALIGSLFYLTEFFVPWYIFINVIFAAVHFILMWYYCIKNHKFALIASLVATLLYSLLIYAALTDRKLQNRVTGLNGMAFFPEKY